jgi:hypothetical protein
VVLDAARAGDLTYFDFHEDRLNDVADFVESILKVGAPVRIVNVRSSLLRQRDYGPDNLDKIPPDSRWQHFEVGGVPRVLNLLAEWEQSCCDKLECTRRLIDLSLVSVLLDAGAGDPWRYINPQTNQELERSEGIVVASLEMFRALTFTVNKNAGNPSVDGMSFQKIHDDTLS